MLQNVVNIWGATSQGDATFVRESPSYLGERGSGCGVLGVRLAQALHPKGFGTALSYKCSTQGHAVHQNLVHDINNMVLDFDHAQRSGHRLARGPDHVGDFLMRQRNVESQPLLSGGTRRFLRRKKGIAICNAFFGE